MIIEQLKHENAQLNCKGNVGMLKKNRFTILCIVTPVLINNGCPPVTIPVAELVYPLHAIIASVHVCPCLNLEMNKHLVSNTITVQEHTCVIVLFNSLNTCCSKALCGHLSSRKWQRIREVWDR